MISNDAVSDVDDVESFYSFNESVDSSDCLGSSLSSLETSRSCESLPDDDFTEKSLAPCLKRPTDEQLDVKNLTLDEDLSPRDYHPFNVKDARSVSPLKCMKQADMDFFDMNKPPDVDNLTLDVDNLTLDEDLSLRDYHHFNVLDPRSVPPLICKKQPDVDLFDMNKPQISSEAIDKYNFTKMWAESHQKREYSPLFKFQCNLKEEGRSEQQTLEEQTKGIVNKNIFLSPVDPRFSYTKMRQVVEPSEPYVSPFEDMPVVKQKSKEMEKNLGFKSPTIVPAGFDLTNLVEFKDPNHWARRPSRHIK